MIKLFKKKEIPSKNYYIVIVVTILVVLLMIFIRLFYLNYKSSKLSESIFSNQMVKQIHMDDFDFAVAEISDSILYVSYTGSNEIHSMEKRLFKEIENTNLTDKIIYIDVTKYTKNNKYIQILRDKFPNIDNELNSAPLFIYIKDGKAVEAMSSELKLVDYKTLNKLVDKYGIE